MAHAACYWIRSRTHGFIGSTWKGNGPSPKIGHWSRCAVQYPRYSAEIRQILEIILIDEEPLRCSRPVPLSTMLAHLNRHHDPSVVKWSEAFCYARVTSSQHRSRRRFVASCHSFEPFTANPCSEACAARSCHFLVVGLDSNVGEVAKQAVGLRSVQEEAVRKSWPENSPRLEDSRKSSPCLRQVSSVRPLYQVRTGTEKSRHRPSAARRLSLRQTIDCPRL